MKIKRIKLKTVSIQEPVKNRLDSYIERQNPRPKACDITSIAIAEWLDRNERNDSND